ncbi:MAG: AAA family ATPase [Phaeodactylibacter sp.]|nr:AAA family ATPase [Phaeodactylibacter sp.]
MCKIPYGISNFASIVREGYYFVDRTEYIARLESLGEKYIFFLRPRRFGKTLWASILQHYYGLEFKKHYKELFGEYYIGRRPSPKANNYLVLRLEYSRIDTSSQESTYRGFLKNTLTGVESFLNTYRELFSESAVEEILRQQAPEDVLKELFTATGKLDKQIYFLVDEYDHFANELISLRLPDFQSFVSRNGFVRKFYETVKTATGEGVVDRVFITGVSPLTLDSLTSGFNIGSNLSLDADFQEMMGFREEEVARLMKAVGVEENQLPEVMENIGRWYNGYRFSTAPQQERLYNPDMALYFAKHYQRHKRTPEYLLDTNVSSDYGKIKNLFQVGGKEAERINILEQLLTGEPVAAEMTRQFSFERPFLQDDLVSLLYYMGLLTITGTELGIPQFGIPNEVIRRLYYQYFQALLQEWSELTPQPVDIRNAVLSLAKHNKPEPLLGLVSKTLKEISNRDWVRFDEKYIKLILVSYLYITQLFYIKSEYESGQKFVDLLLLRRPPFPTPHQFAFELKYLKKEDAPRLPDKIQEGRHQLSTYLQKGELKEKEGLKAWLIIFSGTDLAHLEEIDLSGLL